MDMLKFVRLAVLPLFALGAALGAHAATDTQTFQVKIVITESCKISTAAATDVDFGTHARATGVVAIDAAGALSLDCTAGTPYTIGLNGGAHSLGAVAAPVAGNRRMQHTTLTTTYLPYDLYQDAGRSIFWGNTTGSWLSGTGTGSVVSVPVYGRATSVNSAAGSYLDTVTATITY